MSATTQREQNRVDDRPARYGDDEQDDAEGE